MMRFVFSFMLLLASIAKAESIEYWNNQRKGANFFPLVHRKERFIDAAKAGIVLARLAPNKWLNGRPEKERGDFLIGPKDKYSGIVQNDLKYLIQVLDDADKAGLKVVLTMLSLPGSRWSQHNCDGDKCKQQFDLWKDFKYHKQSAEFWRDLAKALKDHPAIAGYNIINEPCPERANKPAFRDWYTMDYSAWYAKVKDTPADLNLFYQTVVKEIRKVDQKTPIVVDSGFYANPYAFQVLDPKRIGDDKLIFALHNYEPSKFLDGKNKEKYKYPGAFPSGELDDPSDKEAEPPYAPIEKWNKAKVATYFNVVLDWMKKQGVAKNRIYIAEFGGHREAKGIANYFKDLISFINLQGWHWSFYSYREDDGFPQMDYELGSGKTPGIYWSCSVDYTCEKAGIYNSKNPIWKIFSSGLR